MPPSGVDYASEFLNGYAPEYVIDNFWLEGNSKISQKQQIDFLRKFYFSKYYCPLNFRVQQKN